jgi:DNA-binding transcriptional MerR regulator
MGNRGYRVEELAASADVSVDTIRFYQAKGLLPPPEREGRIAWYQDVHLDGLRRIRELKAKGLTLAVIKRLLTGELEAADEALVTALAGPAPGDESQQSPDEEAVLSSESLAERTGVSPTLLSVLEREGFLLASGHDEDGSPRYTNADATALQAGMSLLAAGVPLDELLGLARRYREAMSGVADDAVELFVRFVRDPIQGQSSSQQEASHRLVTAFETMLPATGAVVSHHFRRLLVERAQERVAAEGDAEALTALGGEGHGQQ